MKTLHGASKPKRQRDSVSPNASSVGQSQVDTTGVERASRLHGDSYADVNAREDEFAATTSTHAGRSDRRLEEPSEAAVDAPERLEGG
jgi:hypothetical protein